jgi:uncharacterized phage protein (TIGR01671 family)
MENDRFLFRGKRVADCEWIIGDLARRKSRFAPQLKTTYGISDEFGTFTAVDPATVGQCTGLRDKNGKLIFEGDIVSAFSNINKISDPHMTNREPEYTMKYVENVRGAFCLSSKRFPNGGCGIIDHYCGAMCKDIMVCGNIHDNPEMLEAQNA